MEKILLEEIKKYRLLSSYNPKLTLTENTEIFEAGFSPSTSAREVEIALGKDLQTVLTDYKIVGIDAGKVTSLLQMDASTFEKELLEAMEQDFKAGYPKGGTLGPNAKNLSKVDLFRSMAAKSKSNGNVALSVTEIDKLISDIKNTNKTKWAGLQTNVSPIDPNAIVQTNPQIKKWDWKKLAKWGAGIGIGVGALYTIYKMTHEDEPPIPPPVPTVTPTPRTPTVWDENCTIYKIGCKSDVIAKVQGCVGGGLVADGKFGKKTSAKLKELGYTTFTDADVDKICKTQPVVDPDSEDIEDKDPTLV